MKRVAQRESGGALGSCRPHSVAAVAAQFVLAVLLEAAKGLGRQGKRRLLREMGEMVQMRTMHKGRSIRGPKPSVSH